MEEYDSSKDKIIGKARLVRIGEQTIVIALRSLDGAEGRVAVLKTYVSKGEKEREAWIAKSDGSCAFVFKVKKGDLVIAGAQGRLEPKSAAVVYAEAASFADSLTSSSPAPAKKKASKKAAKKSQDDEDVAW